MTEGDNLVYHMAEGDNLVSNGSLLQAPNNKNMLCDNLITLN